ncbi:2,4-dienoyl-CoA reductase-like NADH-dependent reductase (Old Yellow Enzyme family) [Actinoplanes lutulentus]|uniref:2,4-dienoyl-CoA reductase-like NADH-dependent reductase (Old Yellow Enzyme family) n=1 Tax=Actinoplanes lutulentus TaxID=1287878 RepID=A0A327ZHA5_9ACTN|nr:12-oxophytodienoate reductase [Actinoplanes lutulentus]MBB2944516.1 2,4-dienoyl-CoA reductase-like NADH-dependent reductase (Old Yellow Enzyme family) [Actinoplanes lutulentus]RAK42252.1 2,4-dienoyl-CoA reductase-like NADH-dependent reductase (Old Yellow Enzyme family) [Actinoplanes lutulentus]
MTTTSLSLDLLTAPITLAGLTVPNRFVMAPMTRFRSPGGVPTPEVAAYYRRRAENGVGLIVTEGTLVGHPSASHETTVPRMTAGAAEQGWRQVTDAVHSAGGRIAAQLWHLGSEREGWSWTPATMAVSDIDTIVEAFAESARVAVRAGFDAVEIHAAHGYLLDEFLWPATNQRTDAFGGTPARRAAFPAAVVAAVRAQLPPTTPLIVRFSQFKERDYAARIAQSPTELAALLEPLAAAGADVLHASQRRFWEPVFDGSPLNLAGWARRITGLPAITVGSVALDRDITHQDRLLTGLDQGEFDLVALGRILLGNPSWVHHTLTGNPGEIHPYEKSHEDTYF